jgi:proline iminopeptidase
VVAQLGRALRSGRRGREFKSPPPDQLFSNDSKGNRVFYEFVGDVAAPTLLLIHGSDVDHTFLRPWVDPLADVARLLFVDLVGFGRSDAGTAADWNLSAWADSLADVCRGLGVRPVVAGFSLGGRVAMRLAARHPDVVGALVLVNTRAAGRPDRTAEMYRRLGGDAAADAFERDLADPTPENKQRWFELCQPHTVKRPYTEAEFADMVPPAPGVNDELAKVRNQPEDLLGELGAIGCLTLVMTGADDPMATPEDAADIADAIGPHATVAIVEDSAHGVFRDNPDAFVSLVTAALTDWQG